MATGYEHYDDKTLEWMRNEYLEESDEWGRPPLGKLIVIYAYRTFCGVAWLVFLLGILRLITYGLSGMDRMEMWLFIASGVIAVTVAIRAERRVKRRKNALTQAILIGREQELREKRKHEARG